jgi:hypothetical protein
VRDAEREEEIVVSGFERRMRENEIRAMFSRFGAIKEMSLEGETAWRLRFYDRADAEEAVEGMDKRMHEGKEIAVAWT